MNYIGQTVVGAFEGMRDTLKRGVINVDDDFYIKLNNGLQVPRVGFEAHNFSPTETYAEVSLALKEGYRLIDTAKMYGNEFEIGAAIRDSGIPRDQIFISTKICGAMSKRLARQMLDDSFKQLGVDRIDMVLIHGPNGDNLATWRALEDYYFAGRIRAIGLSNFYGRELDRILEFCGAFPSVVQGEAHVFCQQHGLIKKLARYGIRFEAWAPLASGEHGIFENPVLQEIASARGKTAAQVALRFLTQQNIIVLPNAKTAEHMREDLNIHDFNLTFSEMAKLRLLDEKQNLFDWAPAMLK